MKNNFGFVFAPIVPEHIYQLGLRLADWRSWIWSAILVVAAVLIAFIVHWLFFKFARRMANHKRGIFWNLLAQHEQKPAHLILPALAVLLVSHALEFPEEVISWLAHAVGLVLIAAIAWAALAMLDGLQEFVASEHALEVSDNLASRRIRTQVQVLRHIAAVVTVLVAIAVMLMTFPSIRHLGESLFASAGLAALIAGLAARSTLNNLFAGIQIALTQPIHLEDVVIVEGEWGWIEEITTTYVIVRVWDLRRLVVPLSYFIEKPFQNWTRRTADLLGTVFVYTDYTVPVEAVRQQLHRILETTDLWDRKVWALQVTNANDHVVELRALMSAADSSKSFDLRCYVREKLVEFLQREYPDSLPKNRTEFTSLERGTSQKKLAGSDRAA
jgi:small-conductance mechanosensitive channel